MADDDRPTWPPEGFRLRSNHNNVLVNCFDQRAPIMLDAIIVPSYRPADHLVAAIHLARSMSCPLLVLSSQRSIASQVAEVLQWSHGVAVTVQPGALDPWLHLRTLASSPERPVSYVDRSVKRNVGLLVARMMGWRRVLFMDDDLSGLSHRAVQGAVAHVAAHGPRVAGWRARRYPDNSVACHALRAVGGNQGVFVAGGALLVHVPETLPFFPAVYNEDWLFMYDFLAERKVGWVADVRQEDYPPFNDPERASREEFGDVLAEGLMALIHEKRSVLVACLPGYWNSVLHERRDMLRFIERELWVLRSQGRLYTPDGHEVAKVLRSINSARAALERITPRDLAEFTSLWRHDLYRWRNKLPHLPTLGRIEDALNWLGLHDVHRAKTADRGTR